MITRAATRARNRRRLTHGQYPSVPGVIATAAPSTNDVVVTFDKPVLVSGPAPLTVESRTFVSQVLTTPTELTVTFSGTVAAKDYAWADGSDAVKSQQGGKVAAFGGTFS